MAEIRLENALNNAKIFYDKGNTAMERSNLEYAMDMFEEALSLEPRLWQARKQLRAAAVQKQKISPPNRSITLLRSIACILQAAILFKKNPLKALRISEKLLRIDPLNLSYSRLQCKAAKAAQLPDIAIQTLEIMQEYHPSNHAVLETLAALYFESGRFEDEYECRTAISRLNPNNVHARKRLKDAAARFTMNKVEWKKEMTFRGASQPAPPLKEIYNELEKARTAAEAAPGNLRLWKIFADLQLQKKLYDDAVRTLERCQQMTKTPDLRIERKLQTVREQQVALKLAEAEDRSDAPLVSRLRKQLDSIRLHNASRRTEQYPVDLQLKFEYGKLLFEQEHFTEAIQQFQLVQRHPQRRIPSLLYLAKAFCKKGRLSIAREQLETALSESREMDEMKKELLYELGLLCEQTGDTEAASDCLKKIYTVDIGYRDVEARIEILNPPRRPEDSSF